MYDILTRKSSQEAEEIRSKRVRIESKQWKQLLKTQAGVFKLSHRQAKEVNGEDSALPSCVFTYLPIGQSAL